MFSIWKCVSNATNEIGLKSQPGQGGAPDAARRDLRAELLKAEAVHYAKSKGQSLPDDEDDDETTDGRATKRIADRMDVDSDDRKGADGGEEEEDETPEAKRRRILAETRDLDADSDSGGGGSDSDSDSSEDDSDDEDETAELMRELEKIKRERAEAKEREEAEKAKEAEEQRTVEIARGNPLLDPKKDFTVKRRWDDDVIFKNQARGVEEKNKKKEFVNDLLRSDFHKRFMVRVLAVNVLPSKNLSRVISTGVIANMLPAYTEQIRALDRRLCSSLRFLFSFLFDGLLL